MRESFPRILIALTSLLAAMPTSAQALTDPTRPPNSLDLVVGETAAAASGPVLSSIMLSSNRRLAVIDGRTVSVGDRVGEAHVTAIEADGVRLSGSQGVSLLRLLPDIRKSGTAQAATDAHTRPRAKGKSQ